MISTKVLDGEETQHIVDHRLRPLIKEIETITSNIFIENLREGEFINVKCPECDPIDDKYSWHCAYCQDQRTFVISIKELQQMLRDLKDLISYLAPFMWVVSQ